LSSARDHARETLRAHAAQDRLVSRLFQLSTVKFHINTPRTLGTGTAVVDRRCEWDRGTKAPPTAPAPESSKQEAKKSFFWGGGTWRASNPRRQMREVQDAESAEDRDAEGFEGVGNGVSPPQLTRGSGKRHKLPQRGPEQSPGETILPNCG